MDQIQGKKCENLTLTEPHYKDDILASTANIRIRLKRVARYKRFSLLIQTVTSIMAFIYSIKVKQDLTLGSVQVGH
jgi:hypothetical protein